MEEEAFYISGTSIQGRDWRAEARQSLFGLSLTIGYGPGVQETVLTLPLSIGRARALRRVLAAALLEAGDALE